MKLFGLKTTAPTAAPPAVQAVPGDCFFMRRFDLPAGTEPGEVAGFVELRLEELSPFPLDQLHHGHLRATDGSAVFVFAAYRRRLPSGQSETWEQAMFVLPDFAPVLKLRFPVDTVVLLRSAAALTALRFEAGRELPACAAGRALAADADDDTSAAARRAVLELVAAGSCQEIALGAGPAPQQRAQGLVFQLPEAGRDQHREVAVPTADCWTMDVRDPEFVAAQRKRLGVDLLFWRVVQGAAAALLLLLLGEFFLLGGAVHTSWIRKRIEDRRADEQTLVDRKQLAIGLDDFRQRAIQPFSMFQVLGRGRGGKSTPYFKSATLEGLKLEAEGVATSMAEYNEFMNNLRSAAELAEPPREVTGPKVEGNETNFKIVLLFRPGAFAVAQSQPAP